jgi:lycopene cyclase domain-containing protein
VDFAGQYTYLFLHGITVLGPLLRSFEPRIRYYSLWKFLFPALSLTAVFFLIKDYFFTEWGVWSFNPEYISGIYIFNLPIEECMFFFTVPFACVFIYEVLNLFIKKDLLGPAAPYISAVLIAGTLLLGVISIGKVYTTFYAFSTAAFLIIVQFIIRAPYMGRFYLAYLVHLIPFFIINGILTGLPVVLYNDAENLGIRLGTIPAEDTMYSMLLLGMNISLYEWFRGRAK